MAELELVGDAGNLRRVALKGRLDTQGVGLVELRFNATVCPRARPTIVDFSGVTFLSSMGVRMLMAAARSIARQGVKMVILAPQDLVLETIRSASLEDIIPVALSEEEAAQLLAAQ